MNRLTTATPDTSPLSITTQSIDSENRNVSNPSEILKLDKQGLSNVSLSTRLALRKNTEAVIRVDSENSTAPAPRKRGRPRKNSIQPSSTISSKPKPKINILTDDINAIVDNMDSIFKPIKSISDPYIFNKSTMKFFEMGTGIVCSPLVSQKNIANIGILKIQPLTHYGPYINAQRGFIVLIILNAEPGKLTFDSGHDNLGPAICDNLNQLMVCPNDMFMLHNTSSSIEAELLMILCHSKGNDIDHLKDVKYAY